MSTHSKRGEREREKLGTDISAKGQVIQLTLPWKGEKNKYRQKRKTNEKVSHNKLVLRK
jgi:hypothetical protein